MDPITMAALMQTGTRMLGGLGNWMSGRTGAQTQNLKLQNKLGQQQLTQGDMSFPIQLKMLQQALAGEQEGAMRRRSTDPVNAELLDRLQRRLSGNMPWGGQSTMNAMRGDNRSRF